MTTKRFIPQKYTDPEAALRGRSLPYELGSLGEFDDAWNLVGELQPAIRWPDGRVEPDDPSKRLPAESTAEPSVDLWAEFHAALFTDIWYAHPGPRPYAHFQKGAAGEKLGPRWYAGVWTGPDHDLICVMPCATAEEAERCLSPGGWSPEEAVRLALAKRKELTS